MLVHCSAGVGRTGVVILSEIMIACLEHNEVIFLPYWRFFLFCLVFLSDFFWGGFCVLSLYYQKWIFSLSAIGCSQAPVGATQSEDADGSDLVPVHLRVQGPHPVPPQLPADLTTGISTDDCIGFCSTVVPNCSDADVWICSERWLLTFCSGRVLEPASREVPIVEMCKTLCHMKGHKDLWPVSKQYYILFLTYIGYFIKPSTFRVPCCT